MTTEDKKNEHSAPGAPAGAEAPQQPHAEHAEKHAHEEKERAEHTAESEKKPEPAAGPEAKTEEKAAAKPEAKKEPEKQPDHAAKFAAQLAAAEQPVPDTQQSLKGLRVLIAEDNAMNMEIALHILRKAGIEATAACNGKLAAELYETGADYAFDAILMDIIMPEMGGYEATRRIRESMKPDAATIPIIAMSANAFASDMEQSRAAGMNAHLAKPVDVTKLYQTLQEYCHRK